VPARRDPGRWGARCCGRCSEGDSQQVDYPLALNNRGQVVGSYTDAGVPPDRFAANTRHGFVWDQGRLSRFDVPNSVATAAFGINEKGQISGGDGVAPGSETFGRQHAGRASRAPGARSDQMPCTRPWRVTGADGSPLLTTVDSAGSMEL